MRQPIVGIDTSEVLQGEPPSAEDDERENDGDLHAPGPVAGIDTEADYRAFVERVLAR